MGRVDRRQASGVREVAWGMQTGVERINMKTARKPVQSDGEDPKPLVPFKNPILYGEKEIYTLQPVTFSRDDIIAILEKLGCRILKSDKSCFEAQCCKCSAIWSVKLPLAADRNGREFDCPNGCGE